MRLRMTITGCPNPDSVDEVEVEGASGATAAELHSALGELLPVVAGARLTFCGRPVDDAATLGHPPLVDGAALSFSHRPPVRPYAGAPDTPHGLRSPLILAVVGGPDAGRSFELPLGRHTLGRSPSVELSLGDPGLSRAHAVLEVRPDGIRVADLGSTNGTLLNGAPLGQEPAAFAAGDLLTIGGSRLRLRTPTHQPAVTAPTGEGTRTVNRRPRVRADPAPVSIALPAPPERPPRPRVPWLAALLPLPVSAVMAFFFGPMMLVFALLGPLMMVGNTLGDRLGGRREYAARLRQHETRLAAVVARIEAAVAEERRHRLRDLPDPAEVLATATMPSSRIWERRRGDGDFLTLSAGYCTDTAQTRVIRPPGDDGPEHPRLPDVPCPLPLDQVGVLGLSGPGPRVLAVARSLVGQVAALHSPHDVHLWVLTDGAAKDGEWTWAARLPHAWSSQGGRRDYRLASLAGDPSRVAAAVDRLRHEIARRRDGGRRPGPWSGGRLLVVLDGSSALRTVPGLAEAMADGPSVGVLFIALADAVESLPAEVEASLELDDRAEGHLGLPGSEHRDLVIDEVGGWWADRLSRGLAPLRDAAPAEPDGELPPSVPLLNLVPFDPTASDDIAAQWAAKPGTAQVPVGVGPRGIHRLDLTEDGPHVLVGGTTGSGKSEFLRTLVASLALANRPDQLSLVLIDYKGGAAFRECARLPHTAGLVTDLDGHLADRALVSLTAELKRRERLLGGAGVSDLAAYIGTAQAATCPLARLVIVIDEFRALAEELPRFVDGLVRIAALGRSLGVHLVLATQRPAGVVTADIKANVNLRIALRVRDRSDSVDIIEAPDAAEVSEQTPGRAFARRGGGPLLAFQGASVGEPSSASPECGVRVTRFSWTGDGAASAESDPAGSSALPTDLTRIADAVAQASTAQRISAAPPAWLPPLPTLVDATALGSEDRWLLPLGLADHPARQTQEPLIWDLAAAGHWAFVGGNATGRSTALRTIAGHLLRAFAPSEVHLYALGSGSLDQLAGLPHTGAVVEPSDVARVDRLVARLGEEVARRRSELARRHYSSLTEWRAGASDAPPLMMLLVDDWDSLVAGLDVRDHGALTERLIALLRDGAPAGLRAAVSGGRGLLVGRTASHLTHRALLRLPDPAEAALLGLPASAVPEHQPAGRALLTDGTEVQLAVYGDGSVASWATWLGTCRLDHTAAGVPAARRPLRVDSLPAAARRAELPAVRGGALVFGVGGDELGPVALEPERDGRQVLVAGPPRGGKSTALLALAESMLAAGHPTAVVSSRPGPLDAVRGQLLAWCRPEQPEALIAARSRHPDLAVLVDDADRLLDCPCDRALQEIAELVDRDRGLIVCAASAQAVAAQFRGVAAHVAQRQTGLLLGPRGWGDGELFGIRAHPDPGALPGRGLWVSRGVAVPVQVALPDSPDPHGDG